MKTDAEIADALYGSDSSVLSSYRGVLPEGLNQLRDRTGMSAADADAHMLEASRFYDSASVQPEIAVAVKVRLATHDDLRWLLETRSVFACE